MTRIGRYQIKSDNFTGNASYRREQSRPAQNFPTKLRRPISVCRPRLVALLECIPERHLIHKAFFEIAVPAHNTFRKVQPCKIDAPFDLIGGCCTAIKTASWQAHL
jgi:hypothetical protein